ncbi:MAG: aminotransferase class III-fold pyridoxal phosphate-dependent enzyme [Ignavibacteria bacterium]|nr:aminotransferase class III-fold pyridoxal phosphate-dependent enzyme [Ignavibacteria bacterium]
MPNTVSSNPEYPVITESDKLFKRSEGLIPGYSQTLAKGPTQWIRGVAPKFLKSGKGSHVFDADGNEYIDFNMGIGPIVLGYCYEKVDNAIRRQLEDGITFSMTHPLEVELSEKLREIIPNAESVRFSKTGCDVTSAAVRVSRAFTKREKVLCCGYHGWHDWYIGVTDRNAGIPEAVKDLTYTFSYNDIESLIQSIDSDIACVILEPFVFEEEKNNFLKEVSEVCQKNGTLLIFDEMWTGFRIAAGGAQEYFGVTPDLACYSKAMANGMPVSAITGRGDVMKLFDKEVFFFTTFGGEALSLAASMATIDEITSKNVPAFLSAQGKKLKEGYNKIAVELEMDYTKCAGYNCRTIMTFDANSGNPLEMKSLVQQEMIKRGVLWGGFHNMCFMHSDEDVEYTLKAYEEVLPILKKAVDENNIRSYLKGEPVEPVFRKTGNFNLKPKQKS